MAKSRLCFSVAFGVLAVVRPAIAQSGSGEQVKQVQPLTAPSTRPAPPTRDPTAPGFVAARELPDGAVPSPDVDGNLIIGPTHDPSPPMGVLDRVPHGTAYELTMRSADSRIFPGLAREPWTRAYATSA